MKITKLTTYRLPPRWMFLRIDTDEGVTGWGEPVIEGRARSVEAAVNELSDCLLGKDPARINDLWQTMYRGGFYRGGPILMSAIAGIDQALWDIKGKVLGAPVHELLGGLVRFEPVRAGDLSRSLRDISYFASGDFAAGVVAAQEAIDSGAAAAVLARLVSFTGQS